MVSRPRQRPQSERRGQGSPPTLARPNLIFGTPPRPQTPPTNLTQAPPLCKAPPLPQDPTPTLAHPAVSSQAIACSPLACVSPHPQVLSSSRAPFPPRSPAAGQTVPRPLVTVWGLHLDLKAASESPGRGGARGLAGVAVGTYPAQPQR